MSEPAVDLPDPLEQGSGSLASADDLLAQLAGDEVDRLLGDSDPSAEPIDEGSEALSPQNTDRAIDQQLAGANQIATSATAAPANSSAAGDATEAALDDLFNELNATYEEPKKVAAEPVTEAPVDQGALDTLFDQLNASYDEPGKDAKSAGQAAAQSLDPDEKAAHDLIEQARLEAERELRQSQPASAADAVAAELEEDERIKAGMRGENSAGAAAEASVAAPRVTIDEGMLDEAEASASASEAAVGPAIAGAPADSADTDDTEDDTDERSPLLIRLLEWLNSPWSSLSDRAREALGKVALVTIVNAMAVFVYVMFFRKR